MEKKEVVVGNPVSISGLTLIPVEQVLRTCWHSSRGVSCFGIKNAVAVIAVSPSAKRAFRITGEEISIERLIREAPEIREMLEGIYAWHS